MRVDVCTYIPPELVCTEGNVFTYFPKMLPSAFPMDINDMSGEEKVERREKRREEKREERREEEREEKK